MSLRVERHGDVVQLRMTSAGGRAIGLGVSAYIVNGVMIDSGFPHARSELLAAVRSLGVRGVVITHWHEDHAGNAPALAANGVAISARDETLSILRSRPGIQLYRHVIWGRPPRFAGERATFDAEGLALIHTPGHSPDHQVVWDGSTRTLFSGDLWLGVRARVIHYDEDPYRIIESLHVTLALEPARMFDAHRGAVLDPVEAIRAKIDWLGSTLTEIEQRVEQGWSDREIVRRVLGGEEAAALISRGSYSRRNLVQAARRRLLRRSRGSE
jgi:glyoxylase-like metal-dependent hydrolase (beta-lactamase superfamily II)